MKKIRLLVSALTAVFACGISVSLFAQQSEKELIADLYSKTHTAKLASDFSEIIAGCQEAENRELSDKNRQYVHSLQSWALNRRGEMRLELVENFSSAGNETQASAVVKQAEQDFSDALQCDPTRWRAWLGAGRVAIFRGSLDEALEKFTKVCELNGGEPIGFFNRAEVLYELGKYKDAIQGYSKVIEMNAADVEGLTGRAHCRAMLGETNLAMEDYQVVCRMQPENGVAYLNRADLYQDKKEFELAAHDYETAIAKGDDLAMLRLSTLLATCPIPSLVDTKRSLELAQEGVRKLGPSKAALETLALAFRANNDMAMAQRIEQQIEQSMLVPNRQALRDSEEPIRK